MSSYQKLIIAFMFGVLLTLALGYVNPHVIKETKIVLGDKDKVFVVPEGRDTLNIIDFFNRAQKRNMEISQFLQILKSAGIEYEEVIDEHTKGTYRSFDVFTDKGKYVAQSSRGRIFTVWKAFSSF